MAHFFEFKFDGNIHVQSMNRQSGIFIGEQNKAIGWNAHGKANNVIGSVGGRSNLLCQNVFILEDPDFIDTPIDDRDINLSIEHPGNENTSNLNFDHINVNTMQQNSLVTMGEGHITGMDANEKSNHSLGNIFGNENQTKYNVNINYDQDVVDGIINDQDIKVANVKKE
ncbi:hypothetical protein [Siminovitchia sp. 179-K 8D1 HS]|uniref:hypothetical protein n=1 Tax=Siminovitchia sp. 179-K 8D1 HS TaxID=3142385 RepID=UPI0039A07E4B